MLENIKSTKISKIIFIMIEEKRKLNIIRYNKNLQEKMNKSLLNYKNLSGKYIIFENNGKGKEYDAYNENILYEGEYLNGKRHGKGKEYFDNGKLEFEGEYLNGKRNGKGILLIF